MSRYTVSFHGTVGAGSVKTLVSKRINFPFELEQFKTSFALGQNRTVQLRFYLSFDNVAPSAGPPTGTDLLNILGQSAYVVGDEETKAFPMEVLNRKSSSWLKVYAVNSDGFAHTVDVLAVVNSIDLAKFDLSEGQITVG